MADRILKFLKGLWLFLSSLQSVEELMPYLQGKIGFVSVEVGPNLLQLGCALYTYQWSISNYTALQSLTLSFFIAAITTSTRV